MTIDVEFIGPMKRPWPERARSVEVADGALLADVLRSFGYRDDEATHLSCSVNGVAARAKTELHAGDRLSVTLLLGGG
jgi:hypothetical protein